MTFSAASSSIAGFRERTDKNTGNKYCTHHQGRAPEAGGEWIVSANGYSRRWICAGCLERRKTK